MGWVEKKKRDKQFSESVPKSKLAENLQIPLLEEVTDQRGEKWKVERGYSGDWGGATSFRKLQIDLGGKTSSDKPYLENPWVHAAIKVFAQAMSSVDLLLYPNNDKDADPLPFTHPLVKLLTGKVNPLMTGAQLMYAHAVHRKLSGEDYWFLMDEGGNPLKQKEAGKIDLPAMLLPVRGDLVKEKRGSNGLPESYAYTVEVEEGRTLEREFPVHSVLRFADYDPYDVTRGMGDVESVVRAVELQFQAERYQHGTLKNNGDPGGWVRTKYRLTTAQKDTLQSSVDDALGNPDNAGKWKVIDSDTDYIPNSMSAKDMEYSDLMKYTRDVILAALGVPPPLVGVWDRATYNNVLEAKRDLWLGGNGVVVSLRQVEDTLNAFLIPRLSLPGADKIIARFDVGSIDALQQDTSMRVESAARAVSSGIGLSFNEVATMIGLEFEPPKSGNTHYVTPELIAVPEGVDANGNKTEEEDVIGSQKLVDSNTATVIANLVKDVATGSMPRDAAVGILTTLYGFTEEEAEAVLGSAGLEELEEPEEENQNPPPPPPGEEEEEEEEGPPEEDGPPEEEEEDEDEDKALSTQRSPACRLDSESLKECTERKIPEIMAENPDMGQDQAVAIASNLCKTRCSEKSISDADALAREIIAYEERRSYYKTYNSEVLEPSTKTLKGPAIRFLRSFKRAFMTRLRSVAEKGEEAKALKALSGQEQAVLEQVLEALGLDQEIWSKKLESLMRSPIGKSYVRALANAAAETGSFQLPATDPRVIAALNEQIFQLTGGAVGRLSEAVKDGMLKVLEESFATGGVTISDIQTIVRQNLEQLEASVTGAFQNLNQRALAIARTEAGAATQAARFLQFEEAGITDHEWVAAHRNTRESHLEVDGEKRKLGGKFSNGLRYPHDPDGSAEEVVNCNCTTRAILK